MQVKTEDEAIKNILVDMTQQYADAVQAVMGVDDTKYHDFMARRLVEMAGNIIMGYLLLEDAQSDDSFRRSLNVYVKYGQAEVARHVRASWSLARTFERKRARLERDSTSQYSPDG